MERDHPSTPYLPDEAEIRAACRAIQAGWSAREEPRRRLWDVAPPVSVTETPFCAAAVEADHG